MRTVCEPIANKPLREISFGQVLISLFEAAQRFDAQMQPQLMLIQKTLLQIEGVGRQLYPDLDLWETAQPLLRQWMRNATACNRCSRKRATQLPGFVDSLRNAAATGAAGDSARRRWPTERTGRIEGSRTLVRQDSRRCAPPRCHG